MRARRRQVQPMSNQEYDSGYTQCRSPIVQPEGQEQVGQERAPLCSQTLVSTLAARPGRGAYTLRVLQDRQIPRCRASKNRAQVVEVYSGPPPGPEPRLQVSLYSSAVSSPSQLFSAAKHGHCCEK